MQLIETTFKDFDHYNLAVKDWDLDFRLLSKNDFHAYLQMFSSEVCLFQLKSIPEFQSKSIPFYLKKKGVFLLGGTPEKEHPGALILYP